MILLRNSVAQALTKPFLSIVGPDWVLYGLIRSCACGPWISRYDINYSHCYMSLFEFVFERPFQSGNYEQNLMQSITMMVSIFIGFHLMGTNFLDVELFCFLLLFAFLFGAIVVQKYPHNNYQVWQQQGRMNELGTRTHRMEGEERKQDQKAHLICIENSTVNYGNILMIFHSNWRAPPAAPSVSQLEQKHANIQRICIFGSH